MQTYIVIVSGSIVNVSTVHLNGDRHLIWRYLFKPVLGGHPVLSGRYSIPRGCPLNTGFTVLKCTCSRTFFSGFPISSKSNTEISVRLSIRVILFFPPNIVVSLLVGSLTHQEERTVTQMLPSRSGAPLLRLIERSSLS